MRSLQLQRLVKPATVTPATIFLSNWDGAGSPTATIGTIGPTSLGSLSGAGTLIVPSGGGVYTECLATLLQQPRSWAVDVYFYGPHPPILFIDNSIAMGAYRGAAKLPGYSAPLPTLDSSLHHFAISCNFNAAKMQIHVDGALVLTADVAVATPLGVYCYGAGIFTTSDHPCEYEAVRIAVDTYYPQGPITPPSLPL